MIPERVAGGMGLVVLNGTECAVLHHAALSNVCNLHIKQLQFAPTSVTEMCTICLPDYLPKLQLLFDIILNAKSMGTQRPGNSVGGQNGHASVILKCNGVCF